MLIKDIHYSHDLIMEMGESRLAFPQFKDGLGNLWTDILKELPKGVKMLLSKEGSILSLAEDATEISFSPECSFDVVVIPVDKLPQGKTAYSIHNEYIFNINTFEFESLVLSDEEVKQSNTKTKRKLIRSLMEHLEPLNLAEKYGSLTPQERQEKEYLEKLMITVNRVDISQKDPEWPKTP